MTQECFANGFLAGMTVPMVVGVILAVVAWIAYVMGTSRSVKRGN
jgi:hypothetical protein